MNRFLVLRKELVENGKELTQKQLSKKIGISQKRISNLENGKEPSISEMKAYHDFFNVPYEYLLGELGATRYHENLRIGKELGLSDKAINNIQKMRDCDKDILNWILEQTYTIWEKREFCGETRDTLIETGVCYELFPLLTFILSADPCTMSMLDYCDYCRSYRKTGEYPKSLLYFMEKHDDIVFVDKSNPENHSVQMIDGDIAIEVLFVRMTSLLKELREKWQAERHKST